MIKPIKSSKSESFSNIEIVYNRGVLACERLGQLIKISAVILLLITLIKSISNKEVSIYNELDLILVGFILLIVGYFVGRSNNLKELLSIKTYSNSIKRSIFSNTLLISFLSIIIITRLKASNIDIYKHYFFGEGGIVEWSQVLILISSIRISFLIYRDLINIKSSFYLRILYFIISSILTLITLEEIAWGQTIFSWKTPDYLFRLNSQGETTLHNLSFFQNILDISFFSISLFIFIFVIASKYILKSIKSRPNNKYLLSIDIFFPPKYSWPLFLCVVFISFLVANPEILRDMIINRDQEWAELLLYIGLLISLLRTYILLGNSFYKRNL